MYWTYRAGDVSLIPLVEPVPDRFVAAGNSFVYTSEDAIAWTLRESHSAASIQNVRYLNGSFWLICSTGTAIHSSVDGVTWTAVSDGTISGARDMAYGNGVYVAVGNTGSRWTSADAVTWTLVTSGGNALTSVRFLNGVFIAAGITSNALVSADDGATWDTYSTGNSNKRDSAYGNSIWVMSGANGAMASSPDSINWTLRAAGSSSFNIFEAVIFANGLFVTVGGGIDGEVSEIQTSSNGITWTRRFSVSTMGTDSFSEVAYLVGVGFAALERRNSLTRVRRSTDGITWASDVLLGSSFLFSLASNNDGQ